MCTEMLNDINEVRDLAGPFPGEQAIVDRLISRPTHE